MDEMGTTSRSLAPPLLHLAELESALIRLRSQLELIDSWAFRLARDLTKGSKLLIAGNGGSAAQAQHLSSELVGRYVQERIPLSAWCLHSDSSATSAIGNDYGFDEQYARQVRAHGRANDFLFCLSTSGRSSNLLRAAQDAKSIGMVVFSLTGPSPNPLSGLSDSSLSVDASGAVTQEIHQVAIHLLCESIDGELAE